MKSIINELWHRNIVPQEDSRTNTKEMKELISYISVLFLAVLKHLFVNRIIDAATKELEARIKTEAKTISSKYIDVPNTTDFAVMFLPTEGLYAEVLRIPGLTEWCQTQQHIFVTGPTTVTAFLNSLRVGFANVALNEKSKEVMNLLQAIKAQYTKFGELIDGTLKKLDAAVNSTQELKHRTDIIQKKMRSIENLDVTTADKLLGMDEE